MAKQTTLTPIQISAGKWRLNVPAAVSPTGKRQRLFFATKKAAAMEAERLKAQAEIHGARGVRLPAALAQDAAKAAELLDGYDVSLVSVVSDWVRTRDSRNQSCTFNALWQEHLERKSGCSHKYLRAMRQIGEIVCGEIGERLVSDLDPQILETTMAKHFRTPAYFNLAFRTLRPAFALAFRRAQCEGNPFDRLEKRRMPVKAIDVLTVAETKAVLNACCDHTENGNLHPIYRLDCSDCAAPFAALAFAGIRPGEIERIDWEDINVDEGTIRIQGRHAKTRSARVIEIEDNLREWLATVPEEDRAGRFVPPQWKYRYYAVRKVAGITGRADVLRHSFASYHLSAFADVNRTRSAMGHEIGDTLFQNYRAVVRKKEAIKFWSITPDATAPAIRSTG